ncbi:MAG: hypothetical protein HY690_13165 [Chloroflexi bacterium]|nr:hypothetical protein [Chloroflexota bacterium]
MKPTGWLKGVGLAVAGVVALVLVPVALADTGAQHQLRLTRPIQLGTSGGNINHFDRAFCYGGTLGSLVQDAGAIQYILSNNHVLARTNKAALGDDIIQPGLIDVGCKKIATDAVADLSAFVPIKFKGKGQVPLNSVDAAIARARAGAVATDGAILDVGTLSNLAALDKVGCAVQKAGRTTGLTRGSVSAVNVTLDVNYGSGKVARFADQFLVTPGSFSAGGDSGSLIVRDGATPRAVGLLFAGSPDYTIANPVQAVQSALNVAPVGAGDGTGDCPDQVAAPAVAAATAAQGRHQASLFQAPGVVGVGVGRGPAIEVYLAQDSEQARRQIPPQLESVPVRVIVTGEFQAR